jgi:hypothetical protein
VKAPTADEITAFVRWLVESTLLPALADFIKEVRWSDRENGRGVAIEFLNSNVLSVQWHQFAYSNVGRGSWTPDQSVTFEFAGIAANGEWIRGEGWDDDVRGYCEISQVIEYGKDIAK